ncbi:MAG: glycosyltransferase [Clostridiales bacterium]|nr:glycosyltransferase [Clostridiales bacterium]
MPKISVLMGVYNCSSTLSEAIDSIICQTFTDWELIICDDGSTDSTYNIALEYKKRFEEKIILLQNSKNLGLSLTLNTCLEAAHGEYIARMDGDDISMPDRFQKQVDFLDTHQNIDCVGTGMIRFNKNGDFSAAPSIENPNKYTLKLYPLCYHATIMMRKKAYDALGGYLSIPRTVRCEDIDLWFRFTYMGLKAANLNDYLYKVREDDNALKRRKMKYAINTSRTFFAGYKLLNYPKHMYPFALKSIVSNIIPQRLKLFVKKELK